MEPKILFTHANFKDLILANLKDLVIAIASKRKDVSALSRRNSKNHEILRQLLDYSDNKLHLLLDDFYKKTILKSPTIKFLLKEIEGDIIIFPNGYISVNNKGICKINSWKLLRDIQKIIEDIGDINYLESKNIITSKNIYDPLINELRKRNIIFDVDLFDKNESFINCKTEYYNKIILLQEKMKSFFVEYDFLLLYGMNWGLGSENSLNIKDEYKFSIIDKDDLIINESNIDLLLNTIPIQILLNLNKCKKINSFKVFKELLKNIHYIRNIIQNKAKENGIENDFLDLKIILDQEECIIVAFNCFYKKDLYLDFECDADDILNLDYNEIIYKYYLSDMELNKMYSFNDFKENIVESFKSMAVINY